MNYLSFLNCFGEDTVKKKHRKKQKGQNEVRLFLKRVQMFVSSLMGSGPKKTECQDTCCVLDKLGPGTYFFAVYDGHGTSGREASQTVNDHIQSQFEKCAEKGQLEQLQNDEARISFIRDLFRSTEKKLKSSGIDYSNSGTCAVTVFIQGGKVYIANLGDSRAVMFRQTAKEKLAIELSYDHKPTRPDQRERIEKMGGRIYKITHDGQQVGPPRVWADEEGPGIAMTRTLGDIEAKKIGLISEPEIQSLQLEKTDHFIVVASDGVWDVMTSAEVCGFIRLHEEERGKVADLLVAECKNRWEALNRSKKNVSKIGDLPYLKYGRDDISTVIAFLEFEQQVVEVEQ